MNNDLKIDADMLSYLINILEIRYYKLVYKKQKAEVLKEKEYNYDIEIENIIEILAKLRYLHEQQERI